MNCSSFDSQDAVISDTSWKLRESLDLGNLDILKPSWNLGENLDRTDSVMKTSSVKTEGSLDQDSIPNTLSSFSRSQASSSVGDVECTPL